MISHKRRTPTISEKVMKHLLGESLQQLWSGNPGLRGLIQKSIRAALPPEKRALRMRRISVFLDDFARIYPQDLAVDPAAVQVILDFGEVTPEKTIRFHFINGECITCHIPLRNKLPLKN